MFKNYFRIALRNMLKQKVFSFINIVGLAIGLVSAAFILLWVNDELSYDRFHQNAERIYRATFNFHFNSNAVEVAMTPVPLAAAMREAFPEIENTTRVFRANWRGEDPLIGYEEKEFHEKQFLFGESSLFEFFDIELISGNPATVLEQTNSVVISESAAEKYFGDRSAMGKMITFNDDKSYLITGIAKNMPTNSHFHFDFMGSFKSLPQSKAEEWFDVVVYTYILLKPGATAEQIINKMNVFAEQHLSPIVQQISGLDYKTFISTGNFMKFDLEALTDIHLHSKIHNQFEPGGDENSVIVFSAIALLVIIVAGINFINLSTARSVQRSGEVGLRKAVGSTRLQLISQFLFESVFISLIAAALGLILFELLLPFFNQLTSKTFPSLYIFNPMVFVGIPIGALILGLLAGVYPAFFLSSFETTKVLKNANTKTRQGKHFRNGLVIFQFSASIILIIATLIIFNQLDFLQNKDLGYDHKSVMVIKNADKLGSEQIAFKNTLLSNPIIETVTSSNGLPVFHLELRIYKKPGNTNESHTLVTFFTDYDFDDTYRLNMKLGRFFTRQHIDSNSIILNEAAVRSLNLDNPIGSEITMQQEDPRKYTVCGVVENFNIESLHAAVRPVAMVLKNQTPGTLISARITQGSLKEGIRLIDDTWKKMTNGAAIDYVFFGDEFKVLYQTEFQTSQLFITFTALAIFIACLGLFGLANYSALNRTKEIGIRKVLGASSLGLVSILSLEFTRWVLMANLIAWPAAWFLMNAWLENFAYRTEINIWLFVISGLVALLIALITVSSQAIKTAISNPVNALRYE